MRVSTRPGGRSRRGVTLVESALTLSAFLAVVIGAIDLGIFVFRSHAVAQAARQGARAAIVHGSLATASWKGGRWGTATVGPLAASSSPGGTAQQAMLAAVTPSLSGLNLDDVQVTYEWPDGNDQTESNVRVTVSTTWTPLYARVFGATPRPVSARSTMPIAH